ncbi:SIR2 family protein [Pseudoduganella violacea]|uniref:SIR2-like domain-containing protein n=1 Tax=Pseudoduganella violacea TaxID=1715466 RepID=A0A7W5BG19_9BURK|nr:SIR2 family protein [Pseudoduganella violacea]MBB3122459.1 hypothetical protein [Pseudoduganella violacea]
MDIRFSHDGPAFPAELVDDFINGEVVFLCGAGVSAPQLPLFGELLNLVHTEIGTEPTDGETEAAVQGRFEEAFGSLERRLANPALMFKAVSKLLKSAAPNLSNHKVLLRLARNLNNEVCLITTNFDTFFERALDELDGAGSAALASHAPQSLPSPGGSNFSGVMHIHGRVSDEALGLVNTPLVLTSATYGDAYMRSGWASRFLFDLLRCKTLVLIGYSAGDAPVRYFLNVLEADRQRFSDIKSVYAFDGVDSHHAQADKRWSGVAVTPLAFRKNSRPNYGALWEDLAKLASLVESPKAMRRQRATELLSGSFESADDGAKSTIKWLFSGKNDLLDVVVKSLSDSQWLDFLFAERLVSTNDLSWVLASWCASDWTDLKRISAAVTWHKRLGAGLGLALQRQLLSPPLAIEPFRQAWEAIAKACLTKSDELVESALLHQRLRSTRIKDADLQLAIGQIRPVLTIRDRSIRDLTQKENSQALIRVADLISCEMRTQDGAHSERLRTALSNLTKYAERIVSLGTVALRSVLEEAREMELIYENWDSLDIGVPSVDDHRQNEFHYGVVGLVVLLSTMLPEVGNRNAAEAKLYAETWRKLPGRVGARLWLSALRNTTIYPTDACESAIRALSSDEFWEMKREVVLLLASRSNEMPASVISMVCRRILKEGPTLYPDATKPGRRDWRPIARDREMWIRLKAIERAGVLPKFARDAVQKLDSKAHIAKSDYEESDLFNVYTSGVTYVSGDASVFVNVPPQDKLTKALEQQSAWDPNVQRNWSAYCTSDPIGAFSSLSSSKAFSKNLALWADLIGALSWAPQNETTTSAEIRISVARRTFAYLKQAPASIHRNLANRLADLWPNVPDLTWWDQIWDALQHHDKDESLQLEEGDRFYDRVINRAPGRHAQHLLEQIDRAGANKDTALLGELRKRLETLLLANSNAGWLARGILARHASFVLHIHYAIVRRLFLPWLMADDTQGRLLRATMLEVGSLSPQATRTFKKALLLAISESRATGHSSDFVAANLLRPVLSHAMQSSTSLGITSNEVRQTLRLASPTIRSGAANFLRQAINEVEMEPESAWRTLIKPIFEQIWPQEKAFRHADYTADLAATCVFARAEFPDALLTMKPYLLPIQDDFVNLQFIIDSKVPENFPNETLELLWLMHGPGSPSQSVDIADVLDRIKAANKLTQYHRRFQWLEQRAVRY